MIFATSLTIKLQVINQLFDKMTEVRRFLRLMKYSNWLIRYVVIKWLRAYIFIVDEAVKSVNDATQDLCYENSLLLCWKNRIDFFI